MTNDSNHITKHFLCLFVTPLPYRSCASAPCWWARTPGRAHSEWQILHSQQTWWWSGWRTLPSAGHSAWRSLAPPPQPPFACPPPELWRSPWEHPRGPPSPRCARSVHAVSPRWRFPAAAPAWWAPPLPGCHSARRPPVVEGWQSCTPCWMWRGFWGNWYGFLAWPLCWQKFQSSAEPHWAPGLTLSCWGTGVNPLEARCSGCQCPQNTSWPGRGKDIHISIYMYMWYTLLIMQKHYLLWLTGAAIVNNHITSINIIHTIFIITSRTEDK